MAEFPILDISNAIPSRSDGQRAEDDYIQLFNEAQTPIECIFNAVGSASMCWSNVTHAGEFDADRAKSVGNALFHSLFNARSHPDDIQFRKDDPFWNVTIDNDVQSWQYVARIIMQLGISENNAVRIANHLVDNHLVNNDNALRYEQILKNWRMRNRT